MSNGERVLVTGASGFVAAHIIKILMQKGYRVRGTVRSLRDEKKVAPLRRLVENPRYELELVEANLTSERGWAEAVRDCDYVLHTASPIPAEAPKDENELIKPAVEGVMNVLRASAAEGSRVRRLVLTSSCVAVTGGVYESRTYTEKDFGDPKKSSGYIKSKILAEKAAWDFVEDRKRQGLKCFEFCVVNPGFIVGPLLHDTVGMSASMVKQLMLKELPVLPDVYSATCHVVDVAEAHIAAMIVPGAVNNRHIIASKHGAESFKEYAMWLDEEFGPKGYSIPKTVAPNFILKLGSCFSEQLRTVAPMLGKKPEFDNSRMVNVLKMRPRSTRDALVEMAYSMIEKGYIPKKY